MAEPEAETGTVRTTGFGSTQLEKRAETAATAAAAQVRAQMEFHYVMALRAPRDWDEVRLRILKECDRPAFAREALYNKPIGKGVMGLSIRFAEKALMCMRNVGSDTIVTFDDEQKRIVRQIVTDFENNLTFSKDVIMEKTVERRQVKEGQEKLGSRMNSTGQIVYLVRATEDELLNKEGALISKAMRTNVLRILPGDIQADAEERIRKVLNDQHAKDPEGRKKAMLSAFYDLGIKPLQVVEYIGHDLETPITAEEFTRLLALLNAIKDGETNMREAIEFAVKNRGGESAAEEAPKSATAKVAEKLKNQKPEPAIVQSEEPPDAQGESKIADFTTKLAADFEKRLLESVGGNKKKADVELSAATGGKVQKLADLPQALTDHIEYADAIEAYLKKEEGP